MLDEKIYDRSVEYLERLVSADTARNPDEKKPTRPLLLGLADALSLLGVRAQMVDFPADTANHSGLILSYGPETGGGTVLSGHIDVVSVEKQDWHHPAFALTQDAEKFYGRGTTDMKGFIASTLAVMEAFATAKRELARPVHIALSCDEEGGFACAPLVAQALLPLNPARVIIGEPTEFAIGIAHKGSVKIDVNIKGAEAHSGNPELGISATEILTRLNQFIINVQSVLKQTPDPDFSPPHSVINIGVIQGGVAHNIIAGEASATYFLRPVRQKDTDFVLEVLRDEMRGLTDAYANPVTGAVPELQMASRIIEPFDGRGGNAAAAFMKTVLGEGARTTTLPFNTEASFFQNRGLPTVVCGMGSIAQAHTADEFLSKKDFKAGVAVMQRIFAAHLG
jgi:acetylornithine deacetylase